MSFAVQRIGARGVVRLAAVASIVGVLGSPAMAQNKKNAWEVFLYFGGFFGNNIPAAAQYGEVRTYRTEPAFAPDPTDVNTVHFPNMGQVGGHAGDPNTYPFTTGPGAQFGSAPCNNDPSVPPPDSSRFQYYDECDADQESLYVYNAQRVVTNGEIQTDDSEFTLGLRGGYNITRHWEVELDLGFGKQRVDLTRNLEPFLTTPVGSTMLNDPLADMLADFYEFTWANVDYSTLVPANPVPQEHPNVVASRPANDPNYNINKYYPVALGGLVRDPEVFADVTGFVNRIFLDPTAFRNRGNQINIDYFTLSLSGVYNFNTKADSRIIPYLSAGVGQWVRNFDDPYDGDSTPYWLAGTGIRFFVNEIFAFRADARYVGYTKDSFTIEGELTDYNLQDRTWDQFRGCVRDQRNPAPPCRDADAQPPDPAWAFPDLGGGGGNAFIEVEAELDDFFEFRIGFDVILGGK